MRKKINYRVLVLDDTEEIAEDIHLKDWGCYSVSDLSSFSPEDAAIDKEMQYFDGEPGRTRHLVIKEDDIKFDENDDEYWPIDLIHVVDCWVEYEPTIRSEVVKPQATLTSATGGDKPLGETQ